MSDKMFLCFIPHTTQCKFHPNRLHLTRYLDDNYIEYCKHGFIFDEQPPIYQLIKAIIFLEKDLKLHHKDDE